jgi:replicative superfamily II helicase
MDEECLKRTLAEVDEGHQVLIFVHSRAETQRVAQYLASQCQRSRASVEEAKRREGRGERAEFGSRFACGDGADGFLQHGKVSSAELKTLFTQGLGFHHAGMAKGDRAAAEKLFREHRLSVLVCTATLAWGVNLPCRTVIIRGTSVYKAELAKFDDIDILDVQQIFGRAGRPQYGETGHGVLITEATKVDKYVTHMSGTLPMESSLVSRLPALLNAEAVLGNVSTLQEAAAWLRLSFFYVRLRSNPHAYGVAPSTAADDPQMGSVLHRTLLEALARLQPPDPTQFRAAVIGGSQADRERLARIQELQEREYERRLPVLALDPDTGILGTTELGRIASQYYLSPETVQATGYLIEHPTLLPSVASARAQTFHRHVSVVSAEEAEAQRREREDVAAGVPRCFLDDQDYLDWSAEDVLYLALQADEFSQLRVRKEEEEELAALERDRRACPIVVRGTGGSTDAHGKANILLQCYISQRSPRASSLQMDTNYIIQSAPRILRALFETLLGHRKPRAAVHALDLALAVEMRSWAHVPAACLFACGAGLRGYRSLGATAIELAGARAAHPLEPSFRMLPPPAGPTLRAQVTQATAGLLAPKSFAAKGRHQGSSRPRPFCAHPDRVLATSPDELAAALHVQPSLVHSLTAAAAAVPLLRVAARPLPLTESLLQLQLTLRPDFAPLGPRGLGSGRGSMRWWVLVVDPTDGNLLFAESVTFTPPHHAPRGHAVPFHSQPLSVTLRFPSGTRPPSLTVVTASDIWPGAVLSSPVSTALGADCALNGVASDGRTKAPVYSSPLLMRPLPVAALHWISEAARARLFPGFRFFNALQSQFFHVCTHSDDSVLLGAPTGSGKTVAADLMLLRLLARSPGKKCLYVAPLKSLVRERRLDWEGRFAGAGLRIVELTGDVLPDALALERADVIVTSPEKADVATRSWTQTAYLRQVGLVVFDELHLVGRDRGHVLEAIVSRLTLMAAAASTETGLAPPAVLPGGAAVGSASGIRVLGLTTACANIGDLAGWLGCPPHATFNFSPALRPVPIEKHIQGFPGLAYCPRMAVMNKPAFQAIKRHAPGGTPTIVFVSSRRQTRRTALAIIRHASTDDTNTTAIAAPNPSPALCALACEVEDDHLRQTLLQGVAIHHAGLSAGDRTKVEAAFRSGVVAVCVATSTIAWGVNMPAHLVVVKGCRYFDAATGRYTDYDTTELLQMVGRAGRPGMARPEARGAATDDSAVAVILCHTASKSFYQRLLDEPFPIESVLGGSVVGTTPTEAAASALRAARGVSESPLESERHPSNIARHLVAEVACGTVTSVSAALGWLRATFWHRRLAQNPARYGVYHGFAKRNRSLLRLDADLAAEGPVQNVGLGALDDAPRGYDNIVGAGQDPDAPPLPPPPTLDDVAAFLCARLASAVTELLDAGCVRLEGVAPITPPTAIVLEHDYAAVLAVVEHADAEIRSMPHRRRPTAPPSWSLTPTPLGTVASSFYLVPEAAAHIRACVLAGGAVWRDAKGLPARVGFSSLTASAAHASLPPSIVPIVDARTALGALSLSPELAETPVRHCEDEEMPKVTSPTLLLAPEVASDPKDPLFRHNETNLADSGSSAYKNFLLLSAHLSRSVRRVAFPSDDFFTDLTTLLATAPRILAATVQYASLIGEAGPLTAALTLMAGIAQGVWPEDGLCHPSAQVVAKLMPDASLASIASDVPGGEEPDIAVAVRKAKLASAAPARAAIIRRIAASGVSPALLAGTAVAHFSGALIPPADKAAAGLEHYPSLAALQTELGKPLTSHEGNEIPPLSATTSLSLLSAAAFGLPHDVSPRAGSSRAGFGFPAVGACVASGVICERDHDFDVEIHASCRFIGVSAPGSREAPFGAPYSLRKPFVWLVAVNPITGAIYKTADGAFAVLRRPVLPRRPVSADFTLRVGPEAVSAADGALTLAQPVTVLALHDWALGFDIAVDVAVGL